MLLLLFIINKVLGREQDIRELRKSLIVGVKNGGWGS